ncbi:HAMP domain-containing sensor histidine kinase [Roseisolibacter sp. H3M3-2]|uniref:sensor histidine kinase n=1 Tax=Roseisolibacter sp. H3M3-2 TaxID=3031323 RepID=UPI0023D9AF48|nr:HAMP domain-containing sensor histidine kinase [Roseisolibacter sp. H3M3-2]MDF1502139.1 HAMP domain-containing sensor histidine kinase [Roseisolibacter sp. H3M3-2]
MTPLSSASGPHTFDPSRTPAGGAAEPGMPDMLEARLALLEAQTGEAARLIAELQARDRLKTQFLANISHDLRTPLTAIITHAEILRDGILGDLSERQRTSVQGIIKGGHQLLQMVGEILTYARGAADQLMLAPTEFSLATVVEQLMTLNQPLAAKKGLVLSAEIPEALPTLHADREKLTHVLGNLVGNAIHFTPAGGRVWILAREREGARAARELLVEVGDTGIGIAPEHHELVFREFAQVDASTSRQHHGTGLGLAIARKLVELHGGRIWVESALAEGSRFYFTIPFDGGAGDGEA